MPVVAAGGSWACSSSASALRRRPAGHVDPRLRPQLGRGTPTTSPRLRPARTPRPTTPPCCALPRRKSGSTASRTTATPANRADQTKLHHASPVTELLVHRVLRLARPDRPAGAGVLRHPEVAQPQPGAWESPATGVRPSSTGTSRSTRAVARTTAGCDTGIVVRHRRPGGNTVTRNAEYYTLGHLARFVRPGAIRVASTSFGTTGWNGQVMDVAFVNPDGSTVLVAHNENDDPRTFGVASGRSAFQYTLPGGASRRSSGRARR